MDYEGMLNDLREMRKRIRNYNGQFHYGFAIEESNLLMDSWDFMQEIQEMIACQLTEERMS